MVSDLSKLDWICIPYIWLRLVAVSQLTQGHAHLLSYTGGLRDWFVHSPIRLLTQLRRHRL